VPLSHRNRLRPEHHLLKNRAKTLIETEVDDEVHRRVGDDQGVADATEVDDDDDYDDDDDVVYDDDYYYYDYDDDDDDDADDNDATEVELEAATDARLLGEKVPRQLCDEGGKLADAEDDDDNNKDQGDVVVMISNIGLKAGRVLYS